MTKKSDEIRQQADRAERLSHTVGDLEATRMLKALAKQFGDEADAIDAASEGSDSLAGRIAAGN
jgi:hypothetical protein